MEKRTPKNFLFSIKASKIIPHVKKIKNVKILIKKFYSLVNILEEKLDCILWQLPPSLTFDKKRLKAFLESLDNSYKNVIEFRHSSWFNEKTYNLMERYGVAFCIVSAPSLPKKIVITSDFTYFRFHGEERWYITTILKIYF